MNVEVEIVNLKRRVEGLERARRDARVGAWVVA
jgi:hypothetical protein